MHLQEYNWGKNEHLKHYVSKFIRASGTAQRSRSTGMATSSSLLLYCGCSGGGVRGNNHNQYWRVHLRFGLRCVNCYSKLQLVCMFALTVIVSRTISVVTRRVVIVAVVAISTIAIALVAISLVPVVSIALVPALALTWNTKCTWVWSKLQYHPTREVHEKFQITY